METIVLDTHAAMSDSLPLKIPSLLGIVPRASCANLRSTGVRTRKAAPPTMPESNHHGPRPAPANGLRSTQPNSPSQPDIPGPRWLRRKDTQITTSDLALRNS
ncbi:hypothetical protein EVG20_g10698 [Dentipellis fragilis]|uniref:Uncharacterized protein n=1 Tax=Dentipellis fragilis TaxID=205917 RepID=A0A4Y9XU91_9AGAM|nr:hypothetical protein EVG20_g10698 [Dentipellis fragilis]